MLRCLYVGRALSTKTFLNKVYQLSSSLWSKSGIYDSWLRSLCSLPAKALSLAMMEKEEGRSRNWETNTHWAASVNARSRFVLHLLLFSFEAARGDELPFRRTCSLPDHNGIPSSCGKKPLHSCQDFEKKQTPLLPCWPFKLDQRCLQLRFTGSFIGEGFAVQWMFAMLLREGEIRWQNLRWSICEIWSLIWETGGRLESPACVKLHFRQTESQLCHIFFV